MPGSRDNPRGRLVVVGAVAFVVAISMLLYLLAAGPAGWRDTGDKLASVVGAVVGLRQAGGPTCSPKRTR